MSGLKEKFEELKVQGEKALVAYLMVGYPDYESSLRAIEIALENGVDILELGFPFSDPVADGPTIQLAHEVALRNGIRSEHVLETAKRIKERYPYVPILLMTYYNPIFRLGHERFCRLSQEHGVNGFIIPDLPPEECDELKEVMEKHRLSLVLLASPTSTERRLSLICEKSDEMVYFVSITGTTGARVELPFEELRANVERYREVCNKPVVVGFGISSGEHARRVSEFADGVVVGSLLVKLASERKFEELAQKVKELKEGTIIK
ncbi:tryptophan synthase subunit alpha [Hydrogenivirga sp.]